MYLEGQLLTRKYQDKETGKDRYSTEIRADRLQMLGSRNETQAGKPLAKEPWEGQPKVSDPLGLVKSVEEDPYPF